MEQAQLNFSPNKTKLSLLNPSVSYRLTAHNFTIIIRVSYLFTVNSKLTASNILCPAKIAKGVATESQANNVSVYNAALALGLQIKGRTYLEMLEKM